MIFITDLNKPYITTIRNELVILPNQYVIDNLKINIKNCLLVTFSNLTEIHNSYGIISDNIIPPFKASIKINNVLMYGYINFKDTEYLKKYNKGLVKLSDEFKKKGRNKWMRKYCCLDYVKNSESYI